ncbi:MAG: hypothetical protein RBS89_00915 [Candidatus Delongbacteria bacterium]|jgi:hypothetical protein|nr:hypothetical protein [Candidatus Delongbacteria bacterium]
MPLLTDEEKNVLKESGFWHLLSTDVSLYELGLIDKEKLQMCIVDASRIHKEKFAKTVEFEKKFDKIKSFLNSI